MSGLKLIHLLFVASTITSAYATTNGKVTQPNAQPTNVVNQNAAQTPAVTGESTDNATKDTKPTDPANPAEVDKPTEATQPTGVTPGATQTNPENQLNPACIGEIISPITLQPKSFITFDGGKGNAKSAGMITSTSEATTRFDVFILLKFELNSDVINYIYTLGGNMVATIDLKMSPLFKEFGYYCPTNDILIADGTTAQIDKGLLPVNLKYYEGLYNVDEHAVNIDITKLLQDKFRMDFGHTNTSHILNKGTYEMLNLIVKPNKHCIYKTHIDQQAPTISIKPIQTLYNNTNKWLPCTNSCRKEGAYQCAPVKCFEGTEKCDVNRLFAKRDCADVESCSGEPDIPVKIDQKAGEKPAAKIVLNTTGYIFIGGGIAVVVIVIALILFKKMKGGQKYVQINNDELAGAVYTGGCV